MVIAGFFILTAGAKSDHYAKGKKILKDLVWGLLIIFGAWMITNTLIKLLASESDISASWYKIECSSTGITPGGPTPTPTTPQKFKCNASNQCVADPTGIFPNNTCGGTCKAAVTPTPTPRPTPIRPPPGPVDCSNPQGLAQKYREPYPRRNAPELNTLISCIRGKLPGKDLGSEFSYDTSPTICNYTRGNPICGTCSHAVNSCHFGGRTGTQGALAVDFGNDALVDSIVKAALECGAKTAACKVENRGGANCHAHIVAKSCDSN